MAKRSKSARVKVALMLAFVVVPAAALIGFSVYHLRSIQRDKAIEAAIQRDFQHMLAISEKKITDRAYELVDRVAGKVPCALTSGAGDEMAAILASQPFASHLFTWSKGKRIILRSQARSELDAQLSAENAKLQDILGTWLEMSGPELLNKLEKVRQKGDRPYVSTAQWTMRNGRPTYQAIYLFPISGTTVQYSSIGGMVFDPEYLENELFPEMLNTLLANKGTANSGRSGAVMMVHAPKEPPLATSKYWDGGEPEMERKLETGFPGLVLAIKFHGTTVKAIGQRFLRTSFVVLGGLSVLLLAGIMLVYRGVNKEMELAKIKSDFVSNVSHELRTPLALIRLYAETLELGRVTEPQKQHDYYCTIRKESERLTALINNILDFSRIEAGRKEYDFRETDLPELVHSTLDSYRYQIEQRGFRFEEHIEDGIPPMVVDREAIARSLLNLVNNALKYSNRDRYLAVNLQRENGSVRLEVVDHGIGIPRDEQSKIFEKFYRVSDPLVHNTKGSGLGLCLVRHIAHAHGGEVAVDSTPGKGSKFSVVLPLNPVARSHDEHSRAVGVA